MAEICPTAGVERILAFHRWFRIQRRGGAGGDQACKELLEQPFGPVRPGL